MEDAASQWLPGSFYCRPEWRWLGASYLVEQGGRGDPGIDDEWVVHSLAAIRGRGGDRTKVAAVRAAHDIWAGEPPERRWELEARLLTNAPLELVARRCGLPVAVAGAYAEVFFAVRPMRSAVDWVLTQAIGYRPPGVLTSPQPGGVWKYAGFFGGPIVLDAVIAATTGRPLPEGLVGGSGPARRFNEARLRLLTRLWVASVCAESDEEFARVVAAHERLRALEAGAKGGTGLGRAPSRGMAAFCKTLPVLRRKGDQDGTQAPNGRRSRPGNGGVTESDRQPARTADERRPTRTREG
jgi:hypothetical protein